MCSCISGIPGSCWWSMLCRRLAWGTAVHILHLPCTRNNPCLLHWDHCMTSRNIGYLTLMPKQRSRSQARTQASTVYPAGRCRETKGSAIHTCSTWESIPRRTSCSCRGHNTRGKATDTFGRLTGHGLNNKGMGIRWYNRLSWWLHPQISRSWCIDCSLGRCCKIRN